MLRELYIDADFQSLSESSVYSTEVIQACYAAIDEGGLDTTFLNTARTYTKSLLVEALEQIRSVLLALCEKVMQLFNTYVTNSVRTAVKYRQLVIDKMDKLDEPIAYEYYAYPHLYDYPKIFKMNLIETEGILREMKRIQTDRESIYEQTIDEFVNEKIQDFGVAVLDRKVEVDDLSYDVEKICKKLMRGKETDSQITRHNIETFYDDMQKTKQEKKNLQAVRKEINDWYRYLKSEMDKMFRVSTNVAIETNPNFRDADKTVSEQEMRDLTHFELQRNRMFNGWMTIYRTAFKTKLDILQDKIRIDSNIIGEIFKRTSLFANITTRTNMNKERERKVEL